MGREEDPALLSGESDDPEFPWKCGRGLEDKREQDPGATARLRKLYGTKSSVGGGASGAHPAYTWKRGQIWGCAHIINVPEVVLNKCSRGCSKYCGCELIHRLRCTYEIGYLYAYSQIYRDSSYVGPTYSCCELARTLLSGRPNKGAARYRLQSRTSVNS